MDVQRVRQLAEYYRSAIIVARDKGQLLTDFRFKRFPHGCCGDASDLLAEYLKRSGVDTIWVSSNREDWSHAWLVVKDDHIRIPAQRTVVWPTELCSTLRGYGVENPEGPIDVTRYEAEDLQQGLIIDITADQFPDCSLPVYVGYLDPFHESFEFREAHDYDGLNDPRMKSLYRIVGAYLK